MSDSTKDTKSNLKVVNSQKKEEKCVKDDTPVCDCEAAPPSTIFQWLMSRMTPEQMTGLGVKLVQVNGDELFWMTSVGQLYTFDSKKDALLAEYTWLMSKPTFDK